MYSDVLYAIKFYNSFSPFYFDIVLGKTGVDGLGYIAPDIQDKEADGNRSQRTRQEILRLLAKRSVVVFIVLAIFLAGLSVRWCVPLPQALNNGTHAWT